MQTSSGIKDPIAQYWIDWLIRMSRVLHQERLTDPATQDVRLKDRKLKGPARQAVKQEIVSAIEKELMEWLTTQPPHRYESLPRESCES